MDEWSIRRVVAWTAKDLAGRGIEASRLEAELLVSEALALDRVRLYMDLDRPLVADELIAIRALVKRRRQREPIAYILGRREFWGRSFEVGPAVLVPRPDTETLVERALEILAEDSEAQVLDLCTGSGAIGITLAAERSGIHVDLTDLSSDALAVAARNAELHGVAARARIIEGDLFAPVEDRRYALIVSNPPYIQEAELASLDADVREHEPHEALIAGPTGFEIHDRILAGAADHLEPGGALLIEVGAGQAEELERRARALPSVASTARHADLGKIERVVEVTRAGS